MRPIFSHELLGRHTVQYFQCPQCGIITTETPYWLEEAYQSFYTLQDTHSISRNNLNAHRLPPILNILGVKNRTIIDYGGGYGVLTQLLRNRGYNVFCEDKYCPNIFAPQWTASANTKADLIFMAEVLEHLEDPVSQLKATLEEHHCDQLLLTTTIHSGIPPSFDWPYYGFEHGQHIQFHTRKSLTALATSLNLTYIPLYSDLHLLTRKPPNALWRVLMRRRPLMILLSLCNRTIF